MLCYSPIPPTSKFYRQSRAEVLYPTSIFDGWIANYPYVDGTAKKI